MTRRQDHETTRPRDQERAAHEEVTKQPVSVWRGRVGHATRGRGEAMQQQAGAREDERVAQREDGERQCDNQLERQDDERAAQ